MIRPARAAMGVTLAAGILLTAGVRSIQPRLWPGSRFTEADRDRAQWRGLYFLYAIARRPAAFQDWGEDLLSAFVNIATTNADRRISDLALRMGRERAYEWRRQHPGVPADANADDVADLVYGSDAADSLGVPDARFHQALRSAASRFTVADFLGFDPKREPPPARDRYSVFQDALISAYTFDHSGIPMGAHHSDVLRWLPAMHPYPTRRAGSDAYYDAIYTVTHIVYTDNGYNRNRIAPECFAEEFAYLNSNLNQAIADRDPETLGEYLDSLQAFGLTWSDQRIRRAIEYLLASQNPDGSWGDPREADVYVRYHSTWTALNGIQSFRWSRVLPCPNLLRK
jgi:hypothetical protein